jgi:hypothetical protein
MKIFALLILLSLLVTALAVIVLLARFPGQIAEARGHPQAEAVGMAGWVSLLLPIPLWPLEMIWAYYKSPSHAVTDILPSGSGK